jgi:hypothetical protein
MARTATILALAPALSLGLVSCSTQPNAASDDNQPPTPPPTISAKQKKSVTATFPTARTDRQGKGPWRIFGPALSTGATPDQAASNFTQSYASTQGVAASDLVAQDPTSSAGAATGAGTMAPSGTASPAGATDPAGAIAPVGAKTSNGAAAGFGLMPDDVTGVPGFWLYRQKQNDKGLRVYAAGLNTLVRNDGGNTVVWAASTLRDLTGFQVRGNMKKADANPVKSLQAIQALTDSTGSPATRPTGVQSISTPELIIYAGTEDAEAPPQMAIEYTVKTLPGGKWHFVADADTADILDVDNLDVFASTVSGKVYGNVTSGDWAMECLPMIQVLLPFSELDGPWGEKIFSDATGAYSFTTGASGTFNVIAPLTGQYFNILNYGGSTEKLISTIGPPYTVDFIHDAAGTDPTLIAQANALYNTNNIRSFLLKYVPNYPTISTQLNFPVNVNLTSSADSNCPGNADYDGTSVNLCAGTSVYTNTAFASLIHHEYAHHIIAMGGSGQGEYGEGMADAMAVLFSGHHEFAMGFYKNECTTAIRDAANICQYSASACSTCGQEIHNCGQLLSGAIWDARKQLSMSYPISFVSLINKLTLGSIAMHKGTAITSQIAIDMLTLDDTDGNLNNGSQHYNEICTGFAAHGLICPALTTDMAVSPTTALSAQGPVGGPFAATSVTYTVTNRGPGTIGYQAAPVVATPWLTITNATGQLAVNQSAQVTVAINPSAAAGLAKGNYTATVKFTNTTNGNGNALVTAQLQVGTPQVIYTEDFESGLGTFTVDAGPANLWHSTQSCAATQAGHSSSRALYFGLDSSCTYADGRVDSGTATSAPITLSDASLARLQFNYFLGTENFPLNDQAAVQISINNGVFWNVASNTTELGGTALQDGSGAWQAADIDLTPYLTGLATATLRVRFSFNTVDTVDNAYAGFMLDDVKVVAFAGGVANNAPTVYAGPSQNVMFSTAASLVGSASDDGQPNPPGKLTTTWSKVGGPGTVTFANPSALSTTATFSATGSYTLRLTAYDGALSTTSDVVISVNPPPCAGLCSNPVTITVDRSYQSGNIGTGAICYQTVSAVNGGNCGNLVSPRILTVNGVTETCNGQNWSMPAKRNNGYCIQTTAGNYFYAYVTLFY